MRKKQTNEIEPAPRRQLPTRPTQQGRDLKSIITSEAMLRQFAAALPRHLSADRFARVAITALSHTPALRECSQESFFRCLLDLSAMGLEPDGIRAHLIPFRNRRAGTVDCQLVVGYKGLLELARRHPDVEDVQIFAIRERDRCEFVDGKILHRFDPLDDRGDVRAYYTVLRFKGGGVSYGEPFTRREAERIRGKSNAKEASPWHQEEDFDEMWRKSCIRRDAKTWPMEFGGPAGVAIERDERAPLEARVRDVSPPRVGFDEEIELEDADAGNDAPPPTPSHGGADSGDGSRPAGKVRKSDQGGEPEAGRTKEERPPTDDIQEIFDAKAGTRTFPAYVEEVASEGEEDRMVWLLGYSAGGEVKQARTSNPTLGTKLEGLEDGAKLTLTLRPDPKGDEVVAVEVATEG